MGSVKVVFLLLGILTSSTGETNKPVTSTVCSRGGAFDDDDNVAILEDVKVSLSKTTNNMMENLCVPRTSDDIQLAINDFSSLVKSSSEDDDTNADSGEVAWRFLRGIADSPTFVEKYWHKNPLLIRAANTGGWVQGAFTLERDLRLVDNSYISGYKTAEILRNGTKTDTWEFAPLKTNPMGKMTWNDIEDGLNGGTIYFNTAGSLWPNLGGLCRLTSYAFGLPTNVNVYVTPPGLSLSVPPHTDRQDVFVFQTQGSKRWRVFAPPPRTKGKDPLNRGKASDILSFDEMGPPLIDTVLRTGDVLYVPTGFPHTTDTSSNVDGEENNNPFDETSVHLTMGLDTHVWCLTMAYIRNALFGRCGIDPTLSVTDDNAYWNAMESIPVGFLGGNEWKAAIQKMKPDTTGGDNIIVDNVYKTKVIEELKNTLIELEPERWIIMNNSNNNDDESSSSNNNNNKENLPSDTDIGEVIEYLVLKHWMNIMNNQETLFKDIDPTSEDTLIKAFHCTQEQNLIMENFGKFSKNEAFERSFAQRRIAAEQRLKGVM